jgi:hypothetical protein
VLAPAEGEKAGSGSAGAAGSPPRTQGAREGACPSSPALRQQRPSSNRVGSVSRHSYSRLASSPSSAWALQLPSEQPLYGSPPLAPQLIDRSKTRIVQEDKVKYAEKLEDMDDEELEAFKDPTSEASLRGNKHAGDVRRLRNGQGDRYDQILPEGRVRFAPPPAPKLILKDHQKGGFVLGGNVVLRG